MKRKLNIQLINELMKDKRQKDLAKFLNMPESNLSSGLNGSRTISMGYVLAIAKFFKMKPSEITMEVKQNETNS